MSVMLNRRVCKVRFIVKDIEDIRVKDVYRVLYFENLG